jgi:hypothetical protein
MRKMEASFASASEFVAHVKTALKVVGSGAGPTLDPEPHRPGVVCVGCGERFETSEELRRREVSEHPRAQRPLSREPVSYQLG